MDYTTVHSMLVRSIELKLLHVCSVIVFYTAESGMVDNVKSYRFHFIPWWLYSFCDIILCYCWLFSPETMISGSGGNTGWVVSCKAHNPECQFTSFDDPDHYCRSTNNLQEMRSRTLFWGFLHWQSMELILHDKMVTAYLSHTNGHKISYIGTACLRPSMHGWLFWVVWFICIATGMPPGQIIRCPMVVSLRLIFAFQVLAGSAAPDVLQTPLLTVSCASLSQHLGQTSLARHPEEQLLARRTWTVMREGLDPFVSELISQRLKKMLAEVAMSFKPVSAPHLVDVTLTETTCKMMVRLSDQATVVESVVLRMGKHCSLCVSSQVGCKQGCVFCATGKMGELRNLTAHEILSQVWLAQRQCRELGWPGVRNLVFMGILSCWKKGVVKFLVSKFW